MSREPPIYECPDCLAGQSQPHAADCAQAMTRELNVPASYHLYEITKLEAEVERLTVLLKEARQYVSDTGCDEDHETTTHSCALLDEIDAALRHKP